MRGIALLFGLVLAGCGTHGTIDDPNNQATNDQINGIAANIASDDGERTQNGAALGAEAVGAGIRQSATVKPPQGADVAAGK